MLTCNGFIAALLSESLNKVFKRSVLQWHVDIWDLCHGVAVGLSYASGHLPSTH